MPVWLEIILINLVIGLVCYARGTCLELQKTKEHLEMLKDINNRLNNQLKEANGKKPSARLLADDPMDAILREVGRVKK